MPVKRTIPQPFGTYFITFTCYAWLPLIENTNSFDLIYKWFDLLKSKGNYINGYVIMPNHIHAIISFANCLQSINTIVGNGKRFMAYNIIKRLKERGEYEILEKLCNAVKAKRKENNKQHEIWETSFDWKHCTSKSFIEQKLSYIHNNPCSKKWQLCNSPYEYIHSSAKYYFLGEAGYYPVKNYCEMEDIDLSCCICKLE
jgi:REP element-mobilizing transposase RayT